MDESNLCQPCLNIPLDLFSLRNNTSYLLGTFGDIRERVQSGCHLCAIVLDALSGDFVHFPQDESREVKNIEIRPEHQTTVTTGQTLLTWIALYIESHKLCRFRATATEGVIHKAKPPRPGRGRELTIRRPLADEVDYWRNLNLITDWLLECRKQHKECHKSLFFTETFKGLKMPTRLIDVDPVENGLNPRLITTKSLGDAVVSYTTLSHAWGNPDLIPMCRKNNIDALHHDIDFDRLPKRYQDAVEATRALGLRYLWIDTFCIVQDDGEDITRELGRMPAVYSNAACMISASDSGNADEGCFFPRSQSECNLLHEVILVPKSQNGEYGPISVTIWPQLESFTETIQAGSMSKRGWCFQERELSPRIIHFTHKRLLWECREAIAFEDEPRFKGKLSIDKSLFDSSRSFDCTGAFTDLDRFNESAFTNGLEPLSMIDRKRKAEYTYVHWLGRWYSIVEEFTSRDVTLVQDRLNALAGLAETIAYYIRPHDKYLAGLWHAGLPHHLFWIPHPNTPSIAPKNLQWPPPLKLPPPNSGTRYPELRLPSWSWVSIDGPVRYPYAKTFDPGQSYLFDETGFHGAVLGKLTAIIEDTDTDLCHFSLPFASVRSGYITIRGPTFEATMSEANVSSTLGPPDIPKIYWIFDREQLFGVYRGRYSRKNTPTSGVVYFDSTPDKLPKTTFVFLRLGSGFSLLSGDRLELGLVLLETNQYQALGLGRAFFRRVGIFEIGYWNKKFMETASMQTVTIV